MLHALRVNFENYGHTTKNKILNRMQEVSADEIERLIQAVALYCGISPTGSKTTVANPQNS